MQDLVAKCMEGDRNSIGELATRLQPWAYRFAFSMTGDTGKAEDAVQDALVTLVTRIGELRDGLAIYAWLRQIIRTHVNLGRQRTEFQLECETVQEEGRLTPSSAIERQELAGLVASAIAKLPRAGRETIELYYINERSIAEVSRHLGIPPGTVKRRLHDARRMLRQSGDLEWARSYLDLPNPDPLPMSKDGKLVL